MKKNQFNKNHERHGLWETCHLNGNIWYKGNFKDGKEYGYFEFYLEFGGIWHKGNIKDGKEYGYWEYYHLNGDQTKQFYI